MPRTTSAALFQRARGCTPGGVNSPVRAFRGVGGDPVFIARGDGAHIADVDGNRYIDYVASWGPMLQGHAFEPVVAAVRAQAEAGLGFGTPTEVEVEMAETVVQRVPGIEQVRMVNSGTEATMSAIRLARGFTGRDLILKFDGCYHGHADSLLAKAGSGVLTFGLPNSPGVPTGTAHNTLTAPFNDLDAVVAAFERHEDIAAVILEPIAGNMGCIPPDDGFLAGLASVTEQHGALLIFDEVMTGFRVASGGAQELYGIAPDLTTLGKVIGGGLPVGAFGGRADVMAHIAPEGDVYQAGTLSGNPLAMAAGLAMLRSLDAGFHARIGKATQRLAEGVRECAARRGNPVVVNDVCGMFSLFFTEADQVRSYSDVAACDTERYARLFHALLDAGIYWAPSAFEVAFVSGAHDDAVIDATLEAVDVALAHV